jgi:hypothetical protein
MGLPFQLIICYHHTCKYILLHISSLPTCHRHVNSPSSVPLIASHDNGIMWLATSKFQTQQSNAIRLRYSWPWPYAKVSLDANKSRIQTWRLTTRDGRGRQRQRSSLPRRPRSIQTSGAIGTWPRAGVSGSKWTSRTWLGTNRSPSLSVPRRVQSSEAIEATATATATAAQVSYGYGYVQIPHPSRWAVVRREQWRAGMMQPCRCDEFSRRRLVALPGRGFRHQHVPPLRRRQTDPETDVPNDSAWGERERSIPATARDSLPWFCHWIY